MGLGTVYKLSPPAISGGAWNEAILWDFLSSNINDAIAPTGGLVMDANGNLFGTSGLSGETSTGVAFELTAAGKESILWSFSNGNDGAQPVVPQNLIRADSLVVSLVWR
jgi:hypothetical protein